MTSATGTTSLDTPDSLPGIDRRLLVRWFVDYNPLFTLSALCVLGGVLVLANAMRAVGSAAAVPLTGVVELYQWVLIATTALLYRRLNEHRPGVILGVIALVFLIDPTLQLSALATEDHPLLCVVWVVALGLKLEALAWALCLRLSMSTRAVALLGAGLVAFLPNARIFHDVAELVPWALAIGVFALGLLATLVPPTVTSTRALGDVGQLMLPRLLKAAVFIGVVGAVLQGMNAVLAVGFEAMGPTAAAVALVVALRLDREAEVLLWFAVAMAGVWLNAAGGLVTVGLPLIAVTLFVASRKHAPRVLNAGLLAAALPSLRALKHVDLRGLDVELMLHVGLVAVITFALVGVLVKRRAPTALLALAALHHKTVAMVLVPAVTSSSPSTWGLGLVGAGFVLLPLGVVAHRRFSAIVTKLDAEAALNDLVIDPGLSPDAPSTPAAPGMLSEQLRARATA